MKYCPSCEETKDFLEFNKNRSRQDGVQGLCRKCDNTATRRYNKNYPVAASQRKRRWRQDNSHLHSAKEAKRRAAKLQRTTEWSEYIQIEHFFEERPDGHHVDHIVPLQGTNVSGLHVLANLQYLPAKVNLSKGNKF